MGIFKNLAWSAVGAALKAVNPKRFDEITKRGDRVYELALELIEREQLTPFIEENFRSRELAEAWVMNTHQEVCDEYSEARRTIFPTIREVGNRWIGSVWIVEDDEILDYFQENDR
jgi:hypothetical protein